MTPAKLPSIADLKARAQRIGLTTTDLAKEAGLGRVTVASPKRAAAPNVTTIEKLLDVVTRHEVEQLHYLIALHGVPETSSEQAA